MEPVRTIRRIVGRKGPVLWNPTSGPVPILVTTAAHQMAIGTVLVRPAPAERAQGRSSRENLLPLRTEVDIPVDTVFTFRRVFPY